MHKHACQATSGVSACGSMYVAMACMWQAAAPSISNIYIYMQDQTIITCENTSNTHTHTAPDHRQTQTNICNHTDVKWCKHYLCDTFLCKHTCWTCTNICNHKCQACTDICNHKCQACTNICNHKCWARNDKCKHICKEMWTQMWIYASINVIICNHKRFNTQCEM